MCCPLLRVLPLLLNLIEYIRGTAAATAIVTRAVGPAGSDPHRRALVLTQAAHVVYGIPGGRRGAALEAISCAETAGAVADGALHRALVLLFIAKATAAEGLEARLLDQAARLEADLPPPRLRDSADLHHA